MNLSSSNDLTSTYKYTKELKILWRMMNVNLRIHNTLNCLNQVIPRFYVTAHIRIVDAIETVRHVIIRNPVVATGLSLRGYGRDDHSIGQLHLQPLGWV